MAERRLRAAETAPEGVPGCPECDGTGIHLGVLNRFDIRVLCECTPDTRASLDAGNPDAVGPPPTWYMEWPCWGDLDCHCSPECTARIEGRSDDFQSPGTPETAFEQGFEGDGFDDDDKGIGHARLSPQEAYDHDHPPMQDDPMAFER